MSDTRTPSTSKTKAAREAFEQATSAIAGEKHFTDLPPDMTELEIMEAATLIVDEVMESGSRGSSNRRSTSAGNPDSW